MGYTPGFNKTEIEDLLVFMPVVHEDSRGYFYESYNRKLWEEHNLVYDWVQDNQAASEFGVLRGLHFQQGPHAQSKLVRVLEGRVLDVVVDMRKNSPTRLQHFAIELDDVNKLQLLVPRDFAHGYAVLSKTAVFAYKCDNYYNKESESGIRYNDPSLEIDWQVKEHDIIISEKDKILPLVTEL